MMLLAIALDRFGDAAMEPGEDFFLKLGSHHAIDAEHGAERCAIDAAAPQPLAVLVAHKIQSLDPGRLDIRALEPDRPP